MTSDDNLQEYGWGVREGKIKGQIAYNGLPFEPGKWWKEDIVPQGAETFADFS